MKQPTNIFARYMAINSIVIYMLFGFYAVAAPLMPYYQSSSSLETIDWPSNNINLSDIQQLFSQFPQANQLNIQFPNLKRWNITPDALQSILNNYNAEAQSLGISSKPPGLSFSSLAVTALKNGTGQVSINDIENGNMKNQFDSLLQQYRYQDVNLDSLPLPDWLKQVILYVYDTVYSFFQLAGDKLAQLIR